MFLESGRRQGKCGKSLMGSGHISAAQTVVFDQTHGFDGLGVPIYRFLDGMFYTIPSEFWKNAFSIRSAFWDFAFPGGKNPSQKEME